jgi:serine/threonine protein kinase
MKPNLIRLLGRGTMGEVWLCALPNSNIYYALKKINREYVEGPQVRKYFETEVSIMKELKHINIISFKGLQETASHKIILMEYCNGGSLLKCLQKYIQKYKKPFSEQFVQHLMRQIVSGLIYIHDHNIIHRNIKLDNILVKFASEDDKNNLNMMKAQIKICDFGISIRGEIAFTAIGTPAYIDPIILKKVSERNDLKNSEGYNKSADIWSLGAVCYEMLIGKRVFNGRSMKDLYHNVESGNYSIPTSLSKEVVSFINGMLQYDPDKRLTAKDLSRHYFLTRNINDFHRIDLGLMKSRIGQNGLNINTIKNKRIWDIFNEDENLLISITSENFLENTPSDENKNKNVVRQFLDKSCANNIKKLNNLNNLNNKKYNNSGERSPELKNNQVNKNYHKQNTHNDTNNNIIPNKNIFNFEKNNNHHNTIVSKSVANININTLYEKVNIQKDNKISQNEYTQTNNTSKKEHNQNNNNKYQNINKQNNNIIPPNIYNNIYNQNNNKNINQNIYDKFNNQSYQVVYNNSYNNTYQNLIGQNNYNIYQNLNNKNNYYTYYNVNNQNKNNINNNGNYSNNTSINNTRNNYS